MTEAEKIDDDSTANTPSEKSGGMTVLLSSIAVFICASTLGYIFTKGFCKMTAGPMSVKNWFMFWVWSMVNSLFCGIPALIYGVFGKST